MDSNKTTVLLVDEDAREARQIQQAFSSLGEGRFQVERVGLLADALERLERLSAEVVLLSLAFGIEAVDQVVRAAPSAMLIVLGTAKNSDEEARLSKLHGAYDYLARGGFDAHGLPLLLGYVRSERAAREAQRLAEKRFQAMSDASSQGICIIDAKGICLYSNTAYHTLSGQSPDEVTGEHWSRFVHPKDRPRALAEWQKGVHKQAPFEMEFRYLCKGRRIVWVRIKAMPMRDGSEAYGYVQTLEDITEHKIREFVLRATEDALFDEMELVQATLNSISDAVVTIDTDGKVTYMNPSAEKIAGLTREKALGLPVFDVLRIVDSLTRKTADNPLMRAMHENRTVKLAANSLLLSHHGAERAIEDSSAPIHNAHGAITGAVIVFHDITDTQVMAEKMSHLTHYDFLTGLPNRLLLIDRLTRHIEISRRQGKQVALLLADIDYFKHINDSLGSFIGDQLLKSVAERLSLFVRGMDTICRVGGDEFAVLLAAIESPQDAIPIVEKLLTIIAVPHVIDAHVLHISLSVGISLYPDDGKDAISIMQNADTALSHAKENGRNNFQFFKPEMNTRVRQRMTVEQGLRRALKNGEFVLHYQPKYNFRSGALSGAEALLRWQSPGNGLLFPAQFIKVAEESGLIVPIGQWVLREACRQVQTWIDAGLHAVPMAVNISSAEFRNSRFVDGLGLILQETGVAPRYLELELTESVLMRNAEASLALLNRLRSMGLSLAIDDFGTGYSSLSYLRRFPINTIKIDQSFVNRIGSHPDDATIVGAVIAMGRNLRQQVVAEGVETGEQFSFLQAQHCDEGQGVHFSPPLIAEAFGLLLRRNN